MTKLVCHRCKKVVTIEEHANCPECKGDPSVVYPFRNSDEFLRERIPPVLEERAKLGLDGLVGGLECVIINTEPDRQQAAVDELLRCTGLSFAEAFDNGDLRTCVLKTEGSADFLVQSRLASANPFHEHNVFPKSGSLPNTRLETYVFSTPDIEAYFAIQRKRGVTFITGDIIDAPDFSYIQTTPSRFTSNSLGFIQWHGGRGSYRPPQSLPLNWSFDKPDLPHLADIKHLDHAATRVHAENRDAAIIEFMRLTNYNFDFAIYVQVLNSITNVARLSDKDFAMVFTSGIIPFNFDAESGPTEKFIHNYGARTHHIAFCAENIDETFAALKRDGMEFLIELVGSPDEGLKQTFTVASHNTMLVNEYIQRFGGFDGFFTKSNVTDLTRATDKQ